MAKVQFIVFYTVYFILFELTSTEDSHQLTSFAREHTTFEGMLRSGKEYAKYCTASVNRVGTQSLCSSSNLCPAAASSRMWTRWCVSWAGRAAAPASRSWVAGRGCGPPWTGTSGTCWRCSPGTGGRPAGTAWGCRGLPPASSGRPPR